MMNSSEITDTELKNAYFEKSPFAQNQQSEQQMWPFLMGHKKLVMHAIPWTKKYIKFLCVCINFYETTPKLSKNP